MFFAQHNKVELFASIQQKNDKALATQAKDPVPMDSPLRSSNTKPRKTIISHWQSGLCHANPCDGQDITSYGASSARSSARAPLKTFIRL